MSIYIAHSRTPGSKNGVRKYQNEDGTWTEEGLARRRAEYAESSGRRAGKRAAAAAGAVIGLGGVVGGGIAAVGTKGGIGRSLSPTMRKKKGKEDEGPSPSEKITKSSTDAVNAAKNMVDSLNDNSKRPYLNDLSNKQLREMNERLRLEKEYASLSKETVEKGKDWLTPTLAVAGGVATLAGSAAAILSAIHTIRGGK